MVTAFPATVALASPRSAPWARTGMAKAVNAARKARRFFIDNLRVTVSLRRDSRSTQPREAPRERRAPFCEPRYLRHRARRRFGPGERLQLELPPADVVPAPQLEPGGAEDARRAETQRLVQRHAGRVRQGDAREGAAVAEEPQRLEERRVERLSDATPPPGRAHVDRDLGRPLVGGAGPKSVGVRVPTDLRALRADDPGQAASHHADPLAHLLERRWLELERDRGLLDHRGVDRPHALRVVLFRHADDRGHYGRRRRTVDKATRAAAFARSARTWAP